MFLPNLKVSFFILIMILISSCGNPVRILEDEIAKNGYIKFPQPIEDASLGTLLGGKPSSLVFAAHADTCFNYGDYPEFEKLKNTSKVKLPNIAKKLNTSSSVNGDLIDFMSNGTGAIQAGLGFQKIQSIELKFEDVSVEYMDLVLLKKFYEEVMDQTCKDFLESVGFVIQALKVGKMRYSFKDQLGFDIELSAPIVSDLLSISAGVNWQIENQYELVIQTPKYIGYQLGQLKQKDQGVSLYRATKVKRDRFVFNNIEVFRVVRRGRRSAKNHLKGIYLH